MGRISVDIYPLQVGVPLQEVETFGKYLGGSPTNVAVAAARYGRTSAVITRTGDDPFGEYLHEALRGFGVDDRFVTPVPKLPDAGDVLRDLPAGRLPALLLPLPDGSRPADPAPTSWTSTRSATADVFWVTVTGLCQEPSRTATLAALRARGKRGITVLDLDYRADVLALPRGGARGDRRGAAARHRRGRQPRRVRGRGRRARAARRRGRAARRRASSWPSSSRARRACSAVGRQGRVVEVPPVPVEVVNGLGAGDAFGGALCHGLLAGWELERSMRFCNAAGRHRRRAAGLRRRHADRRRGRSEAAGGRPCVRSSCRS